MIIRAVEFHKKLKGWIIVRMNMFVPSMPEIRIDASRNKMQNGAFENILP